MTSSTRSLLVLLREGTQVSHRRLEEHPLLRPLMASTLSIEQYSRVIAAFAGFYAALERGIQELSSGIDFPGYHYEPRLPLLMDDLAALPVCAVVPCTVAPEYSNENELVGMLYVLEGATQGGRIIAPRVQQHLALSETSGARYFNFYRQDSWREFRAMVEKRQEHYDCHRARDAACATFDRLYSHLEHCLSNSGDLFSERHDQ